MTTEALSVSTLDRSAAEIRARVNRLQEVMRAVMKENVHYGVIPGTDKPTIYKPGAEVVLMTFRIAAQVGNIEDLSGPDEARYRVTMRGISQVDATFLGEGSGECSSSEAKYRWRAPVCDQEFEETAEDRRRAVWKRSTGGAYQQKQVRTEPVDVANTVLKMGVKRALIAMTLVVTAASDVFNQDIEDLPEEILSTVLEGEAARPKPVQPAQRKSANGGSVQPAGATAPSAVQIRKIDEHSGTSKKGKAYKKFVITDSAGKQYSTFTESLAKQAEQCRDQQSSVEMVFEATQYGNDLKEIRVLAAPPATTTTTQPTTNEPASTSGSDEPPPAARPYMGLIVSVDEKPTGTVVRLDTGFVCATKDAKFVTALKELQASKTRVELGTRAARDPKYAPVLEEITPIRADEAGA